jgi:hypothetical protein
MAACAVLGMVAQQLAHTMLHWWSTQLRKNMMGQNTMDPRQFCLHQYSVEKLVVKRASAKATSIIRSVDRSALSSSVGRARLGWPGRHLALHKR